MTHKAKRHRQRRSFEALWSSSSLLLALLGGMLVGGCGFLVDHLVHRADRLLASDFYTFCVAFLFCYVLLQLERRRRSALARRMKIAADVNHHIRNALTGVVYTAAVRNDPALQAVLEDATARIDWVLNIVLPDGSADLRWPVQSEGWEPTTWSHHTEKETPPRSASASSGEASQT